MTDLESLAVRWIGEIDRHAPNLGLPPAPAVRRHRLFTASAEHGSYNHHSTIFAHRGVLYAAWSNHAIDEDGSGQRALWSRSADGGASWTAWQELFPPHDLVKPVAQQDWLEDRVLIPNGFAVVDNELYAVGEVHVLGDGRRGLGRLARRVDDDDDLGPIFWVIDAPPAPRAGFPSYPAATDPAFTAAAAAITDGLTRPGLEPTWEFMHRTCSPLAADGHRLCEPTQSWRLPDGTWVRLYRDHDRSSNVNYMQTSVDNGHIWSTPMRTGFPDACSRSAAGQLPDGTAYVINNPGREREHALGGGRLRDPLIISLASDGLTFDRHFVLAQGAPPQDFVGYGKNAGFQYPRATVLGDALFVMYSINKENIEVTAIPLTVLADHRVKA